MLVREESEILPVCLAGAIKLTLKLLKVVECCCLDFSVKHEIHRRITLQTEYRFQLMYTRLRLIIESGVFLNGNLSQKLICSFYAILLIKNT